MPEFVLEGRDHAARAESPFVLGFIDALFFTECGHVAADDWEHTPEDERTSDGALPCDVGYTDLHPEALAAIRADCEAWQAANAATLAQAYATGTYDESQAGRDYWFTRNGHGVGFWDRNLGNVGDALTEAAGRKEVHAFFGDHVTHGNAPFVHVESL